LCLVFARKPIRENFTCRNMFGTAAIVGFFGGAHAGDPDGISLLQLQAKRSNSTSEQCPTTSVSNCGGVGDTHIQGSRGGNFDLQTPGVMPMATHCNGDHIQFYQCWWGQSSVGRGPSGVRGYAAKFGETVVRVLTQSGQQAKVCIDDLDGCQSLDHYVGDDRLNDVMVQRWQTGVRISRPSTGWAVWNDQQAIGNEASYFNAWVNAPNMRSDSGNDVCLGGRNYPSITWQGLDNPDTPNYDAILFTLEDAQGWCDSCHWANPAECQKPPPAPPPPRPEKECEDAGLPWDAAVKCCEPVLGDPVLYKECLYDFCVEGDQQVCIGYQLVEGSEGRPICLTDKATDECPKPVGEVCANSAKLDLTNVVENTLEQPGGRLVYGQAGTINGKTVDVVVTAADGYTPFLGGDSSNGNEGEFGTINVACGTEAELTFTIVQTGTNTPEPIEQATLSYYDLDEGKRAKGRMTVETCDQDETVLAENTELLQVVQGTCVAVTSSKKGSAADNPTSLMELDDIQRARAVTYTFSKLSTWKSKVSLANGAGGRSFLFSLRPAEACRPGVNLGALVWVPLKPGEKVVPEDRKNCTVGGCPWGKGCCMDKSHWIAQSWDRPNRKIRDSCLSIGFHWCTQGNKQQSKEFIEGRDGGLNFKAENAMTFLLEVGMFTPESPGERPRLNKPLRMEEGVVAEAAFPEAFPELANYESRRSTCISGRIGGFKKCTSGTFRDTACQEQAAVACAGNKQCKAFAFLVKKFKGAGFALGKKIGRKSKGCRGWGYKGDF